MCSEHNVTNLKDYVTLKFRNGSQFDVKNPTASFLAKATM